MQSQGPASKSSACDVSTSPRRPGSLMQLCILIEATEWLQAGELEIGAFSSARAPAIVAPELSGGLWGSRRCVPGAVMYNVPWGSWTTRTARSSHTGSPTRAAIAKTSCSSIPCSITPAGSSIRERGRERERGRKAWGQTERGETEKGTGQDRLRHLRHLRLATLRLAAGRSRWPSADWWS